MAKLTKRAVGTLAADDRDVWLWDDELPGFGLRAFPSGVKSYVVQYRARGRTRRLTLGLHGVLTCEQARERARRLLLAVADGADPAEERRTAREAETLSAFFERFAEQYATHLKPRTLREYRRLARALILPRLGPRKVADLTHADVQRLHHDWKDTPYQANRAVEVLSKLMSTAERWGVRPRGTNPCKGVESYRERRRQRFLSSAELARLGEVLAAVERENVEHASVVPALRLLIFTGARVSEVLTLRWEWVDFERRWLALPDSKTGEKVIRLNAPALQVLATVGREDGSPYVVRGRRPGTCLVNLKDPWGRIRRRAEIADVRVHDLRHSFAAVAAGAGSSLPIIGALLGHTQPSTTQRYAHLADDPLKEAAERVGERIATLMTPKKKRPAPVVELRRKQRRR